MTKAVWIAIGAASLAAIPSVAQATRVITIAPPAQDAAAPTDPAPPLDPAEQTIHTSTLLDFRIPQTLDQSLSADAPAASSFSLGTFNLSLVPEISTWAMTIGGLLIAGLAIRYRRRASRIPKAV